MAKVADFHSATPGTIVYHNNDQCTEGNNIERRNLVRGKGNKKKLCARCKQLAEAKGRK